jgi:hypothetical protein
VGDEWTSPSPSMALSTRGWSSDTPERTVRLAARRPAHQYCARALLPPSFEGPQAGPVVPRPPGRCLAAHPADFSAGITDDILATLSRLAELKVISRTSSMQYRGSDKPVRRIGQELGVAHVVEGSVRRQGERVRITAKDRKFKRPFGCLQGQGIGTKSVVLERPSRGVGPVGMGLAACGEAVRGRR